jgi:antitoxin component HigA of HigAB toxin-antitoxin module
LSAGLCGAIETEKDMNTREPKPAMILRLLTEAQIGKSVNVSIADALEFRRDQYGLTQTEFAAILGLCKSHFSEVLSGKRRLPLKATKRAFAIGVPAEVLLQPDTNH